MPRDDVLVVVGVHENEILAFGEMLRMLSGFRQMLSVQNHPGTEQLRLLHFVERRIDRHDDRCRYAESCGVMRDALRVIPGRHGDDTAAALLGIEARELYERATLLEGRRELLVLELQVHLGSGHGRQCFGFATRCSNDMTGQQRGRCADFFQGDAHAGMIPLEATACAAGS